MSACSHRSSTRSLAAALAGALGTLALSDRAAAQVHGDLGVSAGVSQRVLVGASGGGASPGPAAEIATHVALLPMLRLGAYLHGEVAPTDDAVAAKRMLSGGARLKVTLPWPSGSLRAYGAFGAGYVAAHSPSYTQTIGKSQAAVDGAGGGFVELPVALGLTLRARKPWTFFAELGGRFGVAFTGTLYGENGTRGAVLAGGAPAGIAQTGTDVFAATLSIGAALDL